MATQQPVRQNFVGGQGGWQGRPHCSRPAGQSWPPQMPPLPPVAGVPPVLGVPPPPVVPPVAPPEPPRPPSGGGGTQSAGSVVLPRQSSQCWQVLRHACT